MPTVKRMTAIATIDCSLIEIILNETSYILDTASQIQVETDLEEREAVKLVIKDILRAQKRGSATVTGNTITLTDNVFSPELVQALQGGTLEWDTTDPTELVSYTPPAAGEQVTYDSFTLNAYSAVYDAAGLLVKYEKTSYPNCQGQPLTFNSEDGAFRVSTYTITSAPKQGEPAYKITYVDELPEPTTGTRAAVKSNDYY